MMSYHCIHNMISYSKGQNQPKGPKATAKHLRMFLTSLFQSSSDVTVALKQCRQKHKCWAQGGRRQKTFGGATISDDDVIISMTSLLL